MPLNKETIWNYKFIYAKLLYDFGYTTLLNISGHSKLLKFIHYIFFIYVCSDVDHIRIIVKENEFNELKFWIWLFIFH